jgi:putative restriction endonuclease
VVTATTGGAGQGGPLDRLASLRQHERGGRRSTHKPLLILLALGRLHQGSTDGLPWLVARQQLADLIAEYGPASRTRPSAAYPFTRLRSDGVPMDDVGPLTRHNPVGPVHPRTATTAARQPRPDQVHQRRQHRPTVGALARANGRVAG